MKDLKTEELTAELLLEEIKVMLKDEFVAVIRRKGDEVEMKFPNGKSFTLTVWQNNIKY